MSYNQILKRKIIGSILKNGKEIKLSVATETSHWKRPECVADGMADRVINIVQSYSKPLPHGTSEVCIRYEDQNQFMSKLMVDEENLSTVIAQTTSANTWPVSVLMIRTREPAYIFRQNSTASSQSATKRVTWNVLGSFSETSPSCSS